MIKIAKSKLQPNRSDENLSRNAVLDDLMGGSWWRHLLRLSSGWVTIT